MKEKISRKSDCTNIEIQQLFMNIKQTTLAQYEIFYVDGSKTKDGKGYAYCTEYGTESKKIKMINNNTTIFVAEAAAIREVLKYIDTNYDPGKYCIVSDSLSVIAAVESKVNSYKRHQIVENILDIINIMKHKSYEIMFMWVPSHAGIKGNEVVDKLAQDAITNPDDTNDEVLHFSDLQPLQWKTQTERWQDKWETSNMGRYCFSLLPKVKNKPWYKNIPFSTKRIVFWNRILANHTTSNASLNRFNIVEDPKCECGNYHTIDHILFECLISRGITKIGV